MIKETTESRDRLKDKHNQSVPGYPVYPPVVSYSYRTEHITPIPPNRAVHRLTVCSVNTAEIRLSSSHGVSSDPEQKDMFSSYRCQRASENSATPFNPSLSLSVTSSPPDSPLPEKTKGQTNRERRDGCAVAGDTRDILKVQETLSFSHFRSRCLPSLVNPSTDVPAEGANIPPSLPVLSLSPSLPPSCCPGTAVLASRQTWDRVMWREGGDRL